MSVRRIGICVVSVLVSALLLAVPSSAADLVADPSSRLEPLEPLVDGDDHAVPTPTPVPSAEAEPVPGAEAVEPAPSAEQPVTRAPADDKQTAECQNGTAGPFPCKNVDLESVLPLGGAGLGNGNDVWGWTDPKTGREYALVGSALATTFVDVTEPQNPRTVGFLPTPADAPPDFVLWRDVKVDDNHAFIVSEISGHGMQVFDLTRLRDAGAVPQVFTADALYRGADGEGEELGHAHNIAINEETDFAYVVGSNTCVSSGEEGENGGLHMVDISDPKNPTFAGCAVVTDPARNNYIHDVQCVIYRGPDADYQGHEICFGSNEDVVTVYDVSNKNNPVVVSQWGYPQASYTHQGWLTPDHRFFLFGDELDEMRATVENTTTYIMPTSDLDRPTIPKAFSHETRSIDHNMYIQDDLVYQSNYGAGLRILQFSNTSLSNGRLNEVGYFDIRPGFDEPEFAGTWSNYPYFKSGTVVMSAIEEGSTVLYVLRPTGKAAGEGGGAGGAGGGGTGGGGGGGGGQGEAPPSETGPQQLGDTLASEGGGGALASTGAQIIAFLLLALVLIGAGTLIERLQGSRGDPEQLRW